MAIFADGTAANSIVSQARADVAMLNICPLFVGPPAEPRTQMGQARMSRFGQESRILMAVQQNNTT